MLPNQGLPAIAFFEATACVVLLVVFALLKRDHQASYFRLWLIGWLTLTGSAIAELFYLSLPFSWLATLSLAFRIASSFAFLSTVLNFRIGVRKRFLATWSGPQYPWYWSAGVLAGIFALSAGILSLSVRSLDRLR